MRGFRRIAARHASRVVAAAVILVLYGMARLPETEDRRALAARFAFTRFPLPDPTGVELRHVRAVHPSLEHISAWISSVGAAVALCDLDGDGLPNDVVWVDVRADRVMVAPVPGTGDRYSTFALDPSPLPYDARTTAPMGCVPSDLNEDGHLDVLVYYWGRTPVAFLQIVDPDEDTNGSAGRHRFFPTEVLASGERWYTNAATTSDLDGDGHQDLVIGNYFADDARILDAQAAGAESMQHSMTRAWNGGRNRLLLWRGASLGIEPGVRFVDASAALDERVARGWTLAVGAADLDGDLLPEIYFANDFGPDRLLHNRSLPGRPSFAILEGRRTLTMPASKVLGHDSFKGMGVDFGDLNGDGYLDIYVSNIAAEYALEESHFAFVSTGQPELMAKGVAPYVDRSEPLGLARSSWGWESRLADFDNDGVLEALQATGFVKGEINRWPELQELAIGNDELLRHPRSWPRIQPGDDISGHAHNPFFVRDGRGRYADVAPELGLDTEDVSRGIATADVDGDGDLDFAVANQWERSCVYINEAPRENEFLGLHLLLPTGAVDATSVRIRPGHPSAGIGSPAVGASAIVHLPDGRRLAAQVDGGNGHSGKRSPDLHFGLGALPADRPVRVELRWRDRAGAARGEVLHLLPGWHTVLLGGGGRSEDA
jgi:hypothetical protein